MDKCLFRSTKLACLVAWDVAKHTSCTNSFMHEKIVAWKSFSCMEISYFHALKFHISWHGNFIFSCMKMNFHARKYYFHAWKWNAPGIFFSLRVSFGCTQLHAQVKSHSTVRDQVEPVMGFLTADLQLFMASILVFTYHVWHRGNGFPYRVTYFPPGREDCSINSLIAFYQIFSPARSPREPHRVTWPPLTNIRKLRLRLITVTQWGNKTQFLEPHGSPSIGLIALYL